MAHIMDHDMQEARTEAGEENPKNVQVVDACEIFAIR